MKKFWQRKSSRAQETVAKHPNTAALNDKPDHSDTPPPVMRESLEPPCSLSWAVPIVVDLIRAAHQNISPNSTNAKMMLCRLHTSYFTRIIMNDSKSSTNFLNTLLRDAKQNDVPISELEKVNTFILGELTEIAVFRFINSRIILTETLLLIGDIRMTLFSHWGISADVNGPKENRLMQVPIDPNRLAA